MAKNKKKNKETTIENYYDLKTEQIDDLVSVLKGDNSEEKVISTKISDCTNGAETGKDKDKNFNPYKLDKLSRVPAWIKAFVIKAWSAGMVCYLFLWGLQNFISDSVLLALIDGIVMGVVVDVFVNPAMRFLQSDEKELDWYMMFPFPFKKYWTFFTNIIYYVIVNVGIVYIYLFIGTYISSEIGVEPLLFGVFNFIVDMAFIGIKDAIVLLVRKLKKKKREIPDV
jgi:hypothetical protein